MITLEGTDNVSLTRTSLVKNNITVQLGSTIVDSYNLELTGPTSLDDGKGGVAYQLKISGYSGEDVTITLSADTLEDSAGNTNVETTITSEAIIPDSDDDVPTVSNIVHSIDAINGDIIIDFDITDLWYNFADLIEAGEYTIVGQNYSSLRGWGEAIKQ